MSSSLWKCDIRRRAIELGAYRCGFARAEAVDAEAVAIYDRWLADGRHGTMHYCANHRELRADPRLLLNNPSHWTLDSGHSTLDSGHSSLDTRHSSLVTGHTVIVCAFCYNSGAHPSGLIARYALGADYHHVVRERLQRLADHIEAEYGATSRVCVDTAPLRERYWAERAGVGFIGVNNQLIIPGAGSYFFLGEIITTLDIEPDAPLQQTCGECMACVRACPGGALDGRGGCDARRCLSYLTIEHKGDTPAIPRPVDCIYGCDICQQVCPHNAQAPLTDIPEFAPRSQIVALTPQAVADMGSAAYRRLTLASAMRRVPLKKLKSNLRITNN